MSSTTEIRPTLNPAGNFALGVASDVLAVVATQPLDTIKTYVMSGRGMPPFVRLWNGTAANCSGSCVQGGLPFLVNGVLVHHFSDGEALSARRRVVLAVSTGLATSIFIAPFERVAKMHQLFGGSAIDAYRRAIQNGYSGLFKAVAPVACRDALVSGMFFGGRRVVENALEGSIPHQRLRESIASVGMGAAAGFLSAPFDRANVLMQGDTEDAYASMYRTARKIVSTEGFRGLFKGAPIRAGFLAATMLALAIGEKTFPHYLPTCFHMRA